MRHLSSLILCLSIVCLVTGCTVPWPQNMPPTRYTGMVVNLPRGGQSVPNAIVTAQRSSVKTGIGLFSDETIGRATADSQGRFVLVTRGGYAEELHASSADYRLGGTRNAPHRSADDIVLKATPQLSTIVYHRGVDPSSPRIRAADASIRQLIAYLSAHPDEPRYSLRTYASRGIITDEQLAAFTQAPDLFFGPEPEVDYVWGTQALSFPSVDAPVGFHTTPSLRFAPRPDA